MKDMIKFLKLCKYSFKFKTNCIFLIIFFIIGVINEVVTKGTQYLGGFYIVLTSIYLFHFVMSLSMSDMIQSSGIGRRIQLDMPVKLNGFLSIVLYSLLIVFRLSMARIHPEYIVDNTSSLLMIDIMFFLLFTANMVEWFDRFCSTKIIVYSEIDKYLACYFILQYCQ